MIVVETNFLLELALGQEGTQAALGLLDLAEQGTITLVVPSFSLSEPFATLTQRERNRHKQRTRLSEQLRQLRRSESHQDDAAAAFEPLLAFLQGLQQEEFGRLQTAVSRLLAVAQVIELDHDVFLVAAGVQEQFGLSPQDAFVYASVIKHLRNQVGNELKVFVSLNWKDFRDPGLIEVLRTYGCRYEESFQTCLAQVRLELT